MGSGLADCWVSGDSSCNIEEGENSFVEAQNNIPICSRGSTVGGSHGEEARGKTPNSTFCVQQNKDENQKNRDNPISLNQWVILSTI